MFAPHALSRREVLQTASLLGISAAIAVDTAAQDAPARLALLKESGLVTGKMKPLKYEEIPGLLTKDQVRPHYEHAFYVDYRNRKQDYINRFVQFLGWPEIDRRWQMLRG